MTMENKYNLLKTNKWIGEFWIEDSPSHRFPAMLSYTPTHGIILTVVRKIEHISSLPKENDTVVFHGFTQEAGDITLLDCYSKGNTVSSWSTVKEDYFCRAAIIGGHFSRVNKFDGCIFSANNLDEFCYPQGFNVNDQFKKTPILNSEYNGIHLSLKKTALGNMLTDDKVSSLLLLDETQEEFKQDLDNAFQELVKKHNLIAPIIKKTIGYQFTIEPSKKTFNIFDYIREAYSICRLLTMLMQKMIDPVQMSVFEIKSKKGDKKVHTYPIILSLLLSDKNISAMEKDVDNRQVPINLNAIKDNFPEITKVWHEFYKDELNLAAGMCCEHILGSPNILQHTVLLISALEQWTSKYSDAPHGALKYDWIFDTYCTQEMINELEKSIPLSKKNNESIGGLLSRMRGIVLHPNNTRRVRFKSGITNIRHQDLGNISEMIFIILSIAIYEKIGVKGNVVENIKENYHRFIRVHKDLQ